VYPTPSKAVYGEPSGVHTLAEAVLALNVPVIGLGGISSTNVTETLFAKISGVAVISAILSAADPGAAAASLLAKMETYARHS
jgi:thiamine-phosphate pyrophosphorylase